MEDGWGLATNGKVLFGSDGTSALYQLDPRTLKGSSCIKQLVSDSEKLYGLLLFLFFYPSLEQFSIVSPLTLSMFI